MIAAHEERLLGLRENATNPALTLYSPKTPAAALTPRNCSFDRLFSRRIAAVAATTSFHTAFVPAIAS